MMATMPAALPIAPATIASECLCLGLRRAARAASRRFDQALQPLGLSNGQFSMLTVIAGLQPVGMQALAEHLAMDRTTVTAALKPLQRRGLAETDVSEADARGREVRITPSGRTLLVRAMPIWKSVQRELNGGLAPADVVRLRKHLAQLG